MCLKDKKISKKFFWFLFILYSIVYMTKNNYSAATASIVAEGVLTKSQTGFINAAYFIVYAPLQILGGYVVDRYDPKKMIEISLIGGGIANAIISFNQNYYVMLGAWVFNATVQFALWPAVFKVISSQLEAEYRFKGVYYISFSGNVGLVMAYVVAMFMPTWKYNFVLSSVVLFGLSIIFFIICKRVEKHMVQDDTLQEKKKNTNTTNNEKIPTTRLFTNSGFWFVLVFAVLFLTVSQVTKTLSSTMLMESYANVTPSTGNLLNVFIIIAGILGVAIANQWVYPRRIRSEVGACLFFVGIGIPLWVVTLFLGKVPLAIMIIILCFVSLILSGAQSLNTRSSVVFAKYGKNGTAAGLINAAASMAIVFQSYGGLALADNFGWKVVMGTSLSMLIASAICLLIALPLWNKFKKQKY